MYSDNVREFLTKRHESEYQRICKAKVTRHIKEGSDYEVSAKCGSNCKLPPFFASIHSTVDAPTKLQNRSR